MYAVKAPLAVPVSAKPINVGASRLDSAITGNSLLIFMMSRSAIRSGAQRRAEVCSRSNSQPVCAQARPLSRPQVLLPKRHGECGSPSASLNAWCLRWSATQRMTGPSSASDPATARKIFSGRLVLKDWWVKNRWNPTVMPNPLSR